jgi:hypothetical protein
MRLNMTCMVLGLITSSAIAQSEWKPIFNGKTLDGWTPKIKGQAYGEDKAGTFRVVDGVIRVGYEKYSKFDEQFGHLFYKEIYSNYICRIEYRFTGDQCPGGPGWAIRNSGLMFHCQDPRTMRKDQDFPVSIEAQFLGGLGKGKRTTNNLCTPGTNVVLNGKLHTPHCLNSSSKTFDGDQWVTVEVEVHGAGKVIHRVNGETVMTYEQPQYDPRDADGKALIRDGQLRIEKGYLALQSESHPVEFRKVEIKELKE